MVSKLLLATQEIYTTAVTGAADPQVISALADAYYDIRLGLGFNKSPEVYGAFPADPYSHTPAGSGARQPGMTGQVKEEILTRHVELGVTVSQGELHFNPTLLRPAEFLREPDDFSYIDVYGNQKTVSMATNSLAFTFCQVPVIYTCNGAATIEVIFVDGRQEIIAGSRLDADTSRHIFDRDGQIQQIRVHVAV